MNKRQLSRRQFLQSSGVGLASLALAGVSTGGALAQGDALQFYGWDFQPDTIRQHLDNYTLQSGTPVDLHIIPNMGFSTALQTKFLGGVRLDVYYNYKYNSTRYFNAGWARRMDDLPDADTVMGEMFASSVPSYTTPAGQLISMPYFSAIHVLHYNERLLSESGFDAPPQTKQELYDQCVQLKNDGVEAPYLGYWVKDFCEEYLQVYLLSEGITPFSPEGEPTFADDSRTVDVFEWWQAMFQDGLTSPTQLTDQPGEQMTSMQNGNSAFYVLHHYFLKLMNSGGGPEVDYLRIADRMPGSDGKTFQMGEVVQMSDGDYVDQSWDLVKFYTWKDAAGERSVHKSWAAAAALGAPYPDFYDDPDVQANYGSYYDFDLIKDTFANNSDVVQARNQPWYSEFQAHVGDEIQRMLQGHLTPAEAVTSLADKVVELRAEDS
jgi:multiple sugar transport system substrate-binding protein